MTSILRIKVMVACSTQVSETNRAVRYDGVD